MATYSKEFLSGSTNGKNISITSTTAGSPVTIHTVGSGTSNRDEIWVYACNTSASAVVLTVQFGGTTDQDDYIELELAADSGMTLIVPEFLLDNSLIVKAHAATANVINVNGFVNRITA